MGIVNQNKPNGLNERKETKQKWDPKINTQKFLQSRASHTVKHVVHNIFHLSHRQTKDDDRPT